MNAVATIAAGWLLVAGASGCAAPAPGDDVSQEARVDEEPLEVTVESVDLAHGALRLSATMANGAADVSVELGAPCDQRAIGGGLSTRSTLVWTLDDRDVAAAVGCNIMVRARVRDGGRRVDRVAQIVVAVDLAALDENAEDGPQMQSVETSERGVSVAFSQVARGARLTTATSILEAVPGPGNQALPASENTGRFIVPSVEFARSVLRGDPIHLDGSSFAASLSVGGVALQADASATEIQAPEAHESEEPPPADDGNEEADDRGSGTYQQDGLAGTVTIVGDVVSAAFASAGTGRATR